MRFGTNWHVRKRRLAQAMPEEEAQKLFQNGQLVVTPAEDGEVPAWTITTGPGGSHVRVDLYDGNGSVVESFDYSQVEGDDRLFLDNYKTWVYADEAVGPQGFMDSKANKAWVFRQDGTATCREAVKGLEGARISEYRDLDVSGHWRDRPQWGEWDSFGLRPESAAWT